MQTATQSTILHNQTQKFLRRLSITSSTGCGALMVASPRSVILECQMAAAVGAPDARCIWCCIHLRLIPTPSRILVVVLVVCGGGGEGVEGRG